ncbi:MAG: cytochrome c oxidase subunit 3 [Saprospiraceae bacterium]
MAEEKKGYFDEYENLTFHPYNILLVLLLFGVTALFLALSASLVYTRVQAELPPVALPPIFIFNTLVLLASSGTLILAKRKFKEDDTRGYKQMLIYTITLTLVFLALQLVGWGTMFSENIMLNKDNSTSYLYLISFVHFAHVIGGLPFLFMFYRTAKQQMKEPISVLVYFSDPSKRLKLRLLTIYWHFLDGLWVYLVLFFGINYFLN